MGIALTRLFIPLEPGELAAVVASNGEALPAEIDRPWLVAATSERHAETLARRQAKEDAPGSSFVIELELVTSYLQRLEPRVVGRRPELELWFPASALPSLNRRIARPIALLHAFYGRSYREEIPPGETPYAEDVRHFLTLLRRLPEVIEPAVLPMQGPPGLFVEEERRWYALRRRRDELGPAVRSLPPEQQEKRRLDEFRRLFRQLSPEERKTRRDELHRMLRPPSRPELEPEEPPFPTPEPSLGEALRRELLGQARLWLVSNLGFWRASGMLGGREVADLLDPLRRHFPHPSPTSRATLVD